MNQRELTVDKRLAALEEKVFGKAQGPDGDVRRKSVVGPTPYNPPKAGDTAKALREKSERLRAAKATRKTAAKKKVAKKKAAKK